MPGEASSGTRERGRRWEAADTVVGASLALVASMTAIFVLLCIQGYGTTLEASKSRAERAASVMAEGSRWIVSATLSSLENVADEVSAGKTTDQVAFAFDRSTASLPIKPVLALYSETGGLVWSNSASARPSAVGDMEFFEDASAGAENSLGRLEPESGSARFVVARRLERNGAFAGIAVAIISGEALSRFAAPQDLGAQSTISIIRLDGKVVAREPPVDRAVDLSSTSAFPKLNEGTLGSYVSDASPVDGLPRIVGYHHVDDLGFIALASISTGVAFAGLWYSIWVVSLLLAPFALVVLIGSIWVSRLLRRAQASSRSLSQALERNEQLFREIHHRVKNNLQSVTALLQVHAIPENVRDDLARRIFAMSAVHEHMYRTGDFADVRVKDYLHTLIENVRAGADPGITVIDELEDVTVDKDTAGPLGLILNEVLLNAFKHAFPGGKSGTVKVSLKRLEGGAVELRVADDGVGFDPAVPSRGIGRKLITGFARQVNGQWAFTSEKGSQFVLTFPGQ